MSGNNPAFTCINTHVAYPEGEPPCYQRFNVPTVTLRALYPSFNGGQAMPGPEFFQSAILTDQPGMGPHNLPANGPLHARYVEMRKLSGLLTALDDGGQLVPLPGSRPVVSTSARSSDAQPRAAAEVR